MGVLIVVIGASIGLGLAFLMGRFLLREWVASKVEKNEKFKAVDVAIAEEGTKSIASCAAHRVFFFLFCRMEDRVSNPPGARVALQLVELRALVDGDQILAVSDRVVVGDHPWDCVVRVFWIVGE